MQLTVFATSVDMKNADERINNFISIQSFQVKWNAASEQFLLCRLRLYPHQKHTEKWIALYQAPHSACEGAGAKQSSAQHWHYRALQICLHMGKLLRGQALQPLAWLVCLGFASELNLYQGHVLTVTTQLPMSFGKLY